MRERWAPPHDGDQLELQLFEGVPWAGRSPRALTRAGSGFILKPEAAEAVTFLLDPDQLEFFPRDCRSRERGPSYAGAPLLLESLLELHKK